MLTHQTANAQWLANGTPVCTATNQQTTPNIVPDGNGGAIIVWRDMRVNFDWHIYGKRFTSVGTALWTANGVMVSTQDGFPAAIPASPNGAVFGIGGYGGGTGWDDFAQRIDGNGFALWGLGGYSICAAPGDQFSPLTIPDGFGGVIFEWADNRNETSGDIYVQRIDADGNPLWEANGVAVCKAPYVQNEASIAADGTGGVIVAWTDGRSNDVWNPDVYVQRVNAAGTPVWAVDGIKLGVAGIESSPEVVSNGSGAVVLWCEGQDIYAQRFDTDGNLLWPLPGVPICTAYSTQWNIAAVPDNEGGAFIVWQDDRDSSRPDIYAQRIDKDGVVLWAANGVPISVANFFQIDPVIAALPGGGAMIAWRGEGSEPNANKDIYVQRVDHNGNVTLQVDGLPVCIANGDQRTPVVTAMGPHSALIAWEDRRSGVADIYAFLVDDTPTGITNTPSAGVTLRTNHPNPFTRSTWINFDLATASNVEIHVYDVAGRLRSRAYRAGLSAGPHSISIEPRERDGSALPNGVYFYRLRTAQGESVARKMVIAR